MNGTRCDIDIFKASLAYEVANGLEARRAVCQETLDNLLRLRFGPPRLYDVFNNVCKGPCDLYRNRWERVYGSGQEEFCDCTLLPEHTCLVKPSEMLCETTGHCWPDDELETSLCANNACGRGLIIEDQWLQARNECSAFSSGVSRTLLGLALLLATWHAWRA